MKPTDLIVINSNQRRKAVIGKAFNTQHDLMEMVFLDSYNGKFNNFINLYERSRNWSDTENILFKVEADFTEKLYLQWSHGQKMEGNESTGLRFPGFISYMKAPTKETPHKLVDVDLKNMMTYIEGATITEFTELVDKIEDANLHAKLISSKDVEKLHSVIMHMAGTTNDEFSRYGWVGGVFWGGRGLSYWGDWSAELMDQLAGADLIDKSTNVGVSGYHAQRLCSVQYMKPTLVTNYYCNGDYGPFKYCCPAFFMLKGDALHQLIEKYYKMNFVTTFKSMLPMETIFKWQDSGEQDIKIWDGWRKELRSVEEELRTAIYTTEK
jgi:hypothetical protein